MSSKGARNPVDCSSSFTKKGCIYDNLTTDGCATADDRPIFRSDPTTFLEGSDQSTITFFGPCVQFPYTTHYTVIASDGQVHEYATSAEAIQGFQTLPPREVSSGSQVQTVFPQFCYYHEVICPSGVYRIEFFGPRSHG